MSIRRRTLPRSRLAIALVVTVSTLLAACASASLTPPPAATASATLPSTGPRTEPSLAPTQVPSSATTAVSLRSAPMAPCREDASVAACVKPGTYLLDAAIPPGTVTLDVPAGWFEWDQGGGTEGLLVNTGSGAPDGSGWGLLLSAVGSIPRDPCGGIRGSISAAQAATVDGVLTAIASWPGFRASAPAQSVRLGDVEGRMVELTYRGTRPDARHRSCGRRRAASRSMRIRWSAGPRPRPTQLYVFAMVTGS